MPEAAIVANGIGRRFGPVTVLHEVTFQADAGAVTEIIGENGAGKTTLMRILATLLRPHAGTASLAGFDLADDARSARRRLGLALATDRGFSWRLSGIDNLRFAARLRGVRAKAAMPEIERLLDRVGIGEIGDRAAGRMSTGQRQRLSVARALLGSPEVVLIDEPFRGLDRDGSEAVRALLLEHARTGNTVLVALPEGQRFVEADATWELRAGRIASAGAPSDA